MVRYVQLIMRTPFMPCASILWLEPSGRRCWPPGLSRMYHACWKQDLNGFSTCCVTWQKPWNSAGKDEDAYLLLVTDTALPQLDSRRHCSTSRSDAATALFPVRPEDPASARLLPPPLVRPLVEGGDERQECAEIWGEGEGSIAWLRERASQRIRGDARRSVWFLRFGGTNTFRIWGEYVVPGNDLVQPNQMRESCLGMGRTHDIPLDDLNQTHPKRLKWILKWSDHIYSM